MTTYLLGCLLVFTVGVILTTYSSITDTKNKLTNDLDIAIMGLIVSTLFSWLSIFTLTIVGITYLITKYFQNKTKDSNE